MVIVEDDVVVSNECAFVDNSVISHLLFEKSIAGLDEWTEDLDRYIEMAREQEHSLVVASADPIDRSIALTFTLVLEQGLDPWNLDLTRFSHMYLKHAGEQEIDLITAGRIILMSWQILRRQSDDLVSTMEEGEEESEELDIGWEDLPLDWETFASDGAYTDRVMDGDFSPLQEPIRRRSKRKITLVELLKAFEGARKESQRFQLLDGLRRKERDALVGRAHRRMTGAAHGDHIEEDIREVWNRIKRYPYDTMGLLDLLETEDDDERIRTFVSVLFLATGKKVQVRQQRFPYGKITIKRMMSS